MTTTTVAKWFPCYVRVPDRPEVHPGRKYMVVIADSGPETGLWIFDKPDHVVLHEQVDFSRTKVPAQRQARNGVDVHLADGTLVVVTVGASCKCGALGRWAGPTWSNTITSRG